MERSPSPKILRLTPDSEFSHSSIHLFTFSLSLVPLLLPTFFSIPLIGCFAHCSHTLDVLLALIIPGGFFTRSLLIWTSRRIHVSYFRMYLLFTIICIDMTSVLAKLGCLAPVPTPTFPIVRLGGKGSTSAIVTAGSVGCVPQTA